jgi:hypothetical protein
MMSSKYPISAIHFSPWGQLSGAQRSLLGLLTEQTKHQPTGMISSDENSLVVRAREFGAKVAVMNLAALEKSGERDARNNNKIFQRLVLATGARILHCHSAFGMRFILNLAREAKLKIICHQRDNFYQDDFHKHLEKADKIIPISDSVFTTLPPALRERTSVIYNQATKPEKFVRTNTRLRIGMASRSIPEKGMHLFLDAVIPLMEVHPFDVWIWGLWSTRRFDISQNIINRVNSLDPALRGRIQLERFRKILSRFIKMWT